MRIVLLILISVLNITILKSEMVEKDSLKTIHLGDGQEMVFRWIPPGSFKMGSLPSEQNRDSDESPIYEVSITKGFYLGVYEVTQGQWESVMGSNPATFQQGPDNLKRPVESVSWNDTQKFISALNKMDLGSFRLPTEAEWEYACRAGTSTSYYWPDQDTWTVHQYAWCNSRSFATTHPVGLKVPNQWGLYDMSGNVWEWCQDWYGPYDENAVIDPQGPLSGDEKVFRGGSWFDFPKSVRSANRHRHIPDKPYTAIGFRLILEEVTK